MCTLDRLVINRLAINRLAINATVYALVGSDPNKPLPSHTSIGCYPLAYLTLKQKLLCAECASHHTDEMDPVIEGAVHWKGAYVECRECMCNIESACGEENAA